MLVSVIICTYGRPEHVRGLLRCLEGQDYCPFEVLIVNGRGADSKLLGEIVSQSRRLDVKVIASEKGLTRQRNVGMRAAKGDLICLIDDDVAFEPDFLSTAVSVFQRPDMQDVGGISGYDTLNYPAPITARWRLRRFLGVVPSLEPGAVNRLGSSVPVSFLRPFSGCRPVGFFYGFCMIYRAAAIAGMSFDEQLPTYGGEDRDFSFRLSRRWRLMICGDLHLRHFQTPQARESAVRRMYQTGFGAGRTFAKHRTGRLDYMGLVRAMACDFLIDTAGFLQRPSLQRFLMPFARAAGMLAGVRSYLPANSASILKTV